MIIQNNLNYGVHFMNLKMKKKNDEYSRMLSFFMSLLILVSLTVAFIYVWADINEDIVLAFYKKGHIVIAILYFILQYLFSRIYGALKIGFYKVSDIVYSQMLTTLIVDFIMYLVMSLVARQMLSLAPMLLLLIIQLIIVIAWAYIGTFIYKKVYPPYRLIVVYGSKSATNLVKKMCVREDQFQICEAIKLEEGMERIEERILEYDGAIICDIPGSDRNDILKYCFDNNKRVYVTPKISDILIRGGENIHLFDTPLLLCRNNGFTFEQRILKRVLDIIVALVGLIVTGPFMLITALAIKLQDGGPVFYKQKRVTLNGKEFDIIKFRSMIVDAEADGKSHPATDDDDRITPVGKFIRAIRFDEMPQIFNILKGDMSVVGPRPERVEHVEQYTNEIPEFQYRLKVKAGLTGYAQIYGKYNTTAYDKLKLDLFYIENYSLRTDIQLIFMTIKVLFMKESTEGFDEQK